jgi:hypothetical protein
MVFCSCGYKLLGLNMGWNVCVYITYIGENWRKNGPMAVDVRASTSVSVCQYKYCQPIMQHSERRPMLIFATRTVQEIHSYDFTGGIFKTLPTEKLR